MPADVVEHAVGVDDAVALAEDDVAFHVDLERRVVLLRDFADVAAGERAGPDHGSVGLDVDRAQRTERRGQAIGVESFDNHIHAAANDDDALAALRLLEFGVEADVAPLQHANSAERSGPGRDERSRRRHGLRELSLLDRRVLHGDVFGRVRQSGYVRLRTEPSQTAGDDRRRDGRRWFQFGQREFDFAVGREPTEPVGRLQLIATRVGGRRRLGERDRLPALAFEIGDQLFRRERLVVFGRCAAIEPDHRFRPADIGLALADLAVAVEMPDVVRTLPPVFRFVGSNVDRRDLFGAGSVIASWASACSRAISVS